MAAFVLAWLEGAVSSRDALEPSLGVTVERQVWTVVRLSGELDYESHADFDDRLFVLIRAAVQPYICIDVSGLEFCDSRGVACLMRAWRTSRERGGALVLVQDSYPSLGWAGMHLQPPAAVAAALSRDDGRQGGVLAVGSAQDGSAVAALGSQLGLESRIWDN